MRVLPLHGAAVGLEVGEPVASELLRPDPYDNAVRREMRTELVHHPEACGDFFVGVREADAHRAPDLSPPSSGLGAQLRATAPPRLVGQRASPTSPLAEDRTVLNVEMDVREVRVARVPAQGQSRFDSHSATAVEGQLSPSAFALVTKRRSKAQRRISWSFRAAERTGAQLPAARSLCHARRPATQ